LVWFGGFKVFQYAMSLLTLIMFVTVLATVRSCLVALALVPIHLLWLNIHQVQPFYAILGAFFMPLLALTLILLNNRKELVGRQFKNSLLINLILLITLGFFSYIGLKEIVDIFSGL